MIEGKQPARIQYVVGLILARKSAELRQDNDKVERRREKRRTSPTTGSSIEM
jgi:hypothetical protein